MRPARRRQHDHRLLAAGNRFYAPPPRPDPVHLVLPGQAPRPAWLRLGGYVEADGERLVIVSIRPDGQGGWELMGQRTANRWYRAGEVTPL